MILMFLIILFSFFVIIFRSPIYSVISLIVVFFLYSILYLILGFEFFALLLIIIYAGAVSVLFLFVVMTLNLSNLFYVKSNINFLFFSSVFFSFFIIYLFITQSDFYYGLPFSNLESSAFSFEDNVSANFYLNSTTSQLGTNWWFNRCVNEEIFDIIWVCIYSYADPEYALGSYALDIVFLINSIDIFISDNFGIDALTTSYDSLILSNHIDFFYTNSYNTKESFVYSTSKFFNYSFLRFYQNSILVRNYFADFFLEPDSLSLNDTVKLSQSLYNYNALSFVVSALVLLAAMISSIILTLNPSRPLKRQDIYIQIERDNQHFLRNVEYSSENSRQAV